MVHFGSQQAVVSSVFWRDNDMSPIFLWISRSMVLNKMSGLPPSLKGGVNLRLIDLYPECVGILAPFEA